MGQLRVIREEIDHQDVFAGPELAEITETFAANETHGRAGNGLLMRETRRHLNEWGAHKNLQWRETERRTEKEKERERERGKVRVKLTNEQSEALNS
jgi:hypothetical protein